MNKDNWLKRLKEKESGISDALKSVLQHKVSKEQGSAIMDEYYGVNKNLTTEGKLNEIEKQNSEKEQHYRWGHGNVENEKPFDTVKIHDREYELIHGQYPHSRQDNTTYARSKGDPKEVYDFDGHRLPFKIVIEESNYIKRSSLSGDEVRKACTGKLFLGDKQIFECGGRKYERAYKNIERFIDDMEENWYWFPNKTEEYIGKFVKYKNQMFVIKSFVISQACLMLETPDGKQRKPFASETEEGDYEEESIIKVEITDRNIWWFPSNKEIEQYKSKTN